MNIKENGVRFKSKLIDLPATIIKLFTGPLSYAKENIKNTGG